jgi:hypothetical protein
MIRAYQGLPRTAKMTSERNAKTMLAKLATLSCWMRRGPTACLHVRGVGVLMLMCVSVIACGHRALDKAALQEKAKVSAVRAEGSPSGAASEARNAEQATATPSAAMLKEHVVSGTPTKQAASAGGMSKLEAPLFEGVIGEASFSLESLPIEEAPRAATDSDVLPAPTPAGAAASNESLASRFHWGLLLGSVALLVIAGLALALAFDNRRHRRLRMAVRLAPVMGNEALVGDSATPMPEQKETELPPVAVDASSMMPGPIFTFVMEDGRLPGSAHRDHGPIPFSRLDWCYSPGKFESPEQWAMESPVDFLPAWLSAQMARKVELPHVESGESVESKDVAGSVGSAQPVSASAAAEDAPPTAQSVAEPGWEPAIESDPLAELFDRLEHHAMRESSDIPLLLVERDSDLPQILRTTAEAVPQNVLKTWESMLRQAIAGAHSLTLPSLLVSTLLLRADDADPHDAETLYAEAERWIDLSVASDHERRAAWEARRLNVDLRRAKRKQGAARLLWLRAVQARYAPQLAQGAPPMLLAWIDVLTFWAQCQLGDAALSRYTEAEAVCLRLGELPACADAAQQRRADVLRRRATVEQGGARMHSLDTAQALADALYASMPTAENALAIAEIALARGNVLPPVQAQQAYSHALMHAFMAENDPRWREQALQCRLAVQWAYENLPGMDVQGDVAFKLAERLQTLRVKDPDTLHRMAQTYLRNADFAGTCQLCEHAWRNGAATPALLSTWQEACRQWTRTSSPQEQCVARQQTMRQLSIASAMR